MGTISTKNHQHHSIKNKSDAIVAVTGCIRHFTKQYEFNYYDHIPICVLNLIIQWYYFDENESDLSNLSFSSLKVGQKIDVKDDWEKYYGAVILYRKDPGKHCPNSSSNESQTNDNNNNTIQRLNTSPGIKYLYPNDWMNNLGLFIHYNGCSSRYDEWIFLNRKGTICDCHDICHHKDIHFVARHNTQSQHHGIPQNPQYGMPCMKQCVGLTNLGNTSWMNAILQCLFHTTELSQFILSGQYKSIAMDNTNTKQQQQWMHTNHHSLTKTKKRKKARVTCDLAVLLHDLFVNLKSNEYRTVSPIKLKQYILSHKSENNIIFKDDCVDKTMHFLDWILQKLLKDCHLNSIQHIFEGRLQLINTSNAQNIPHTHHPNINFNDHSIHNNSNIAHFNIDIPHPQSRLSYNPHSFAFGNALPHVNVSNNGQTGQTLLTSKFLHLSLPIVNGMIRKFIVDVFDERCGDVANMNPPVRHIIEMRRDGNVRDLEIKMKEIHEINIENQGVFFYRLWGFRCCYVWNSFESLVDVDSHIACYILRDWLPSNHICHIHHSQPLKGFVDDADSNENNNNYTVTDEDNEIEHRLKDPYAFGWPFIVSLPTGNMRGRTVHKIVYTRLYEWLGPDVLEKPPPILNEIYNNNNRNTAEQIETDWDILLVDLPYTLRWVHKNFNFYFDTQKPPIVSASEVLIEYTWNRHANIVIEWNEKYYPIVQPLLHTLKYMNERDKTVCVHDVDKVSIYDCIDAYLEQKLHKNKYQNAVVVNGEVAGGNLSLKLNLWSMPDVLIVHLSRFFESTLKRLNKVHSRVGFIPTMVDYPIYDLDLSKYMSEELLTMNAKYDLYAICCHCGTDHFYAIVNKGDMKGKKDGEWFRFEDTEIKKINKLSLVNNKACILFYRKQKQSVKVAKHSMLHRYF